MSRHRRTGLVARIRSWWSGPGWDAPVSRERVREAAARLLAGQMSEREFIDWVHIHVGHGGYDDLEDLVDLDDEYDPVDFLEADQWFRESPEAEAERERVREHARRLIAEG